jgi:hypothetical protein
MVKQLSSPERPRVGQRRQLAWTVGAGDLSLPRHVKWLYFRADAAFANPEIHEFLEAEGMNGATRACV